MSEFIIQSPPVEKKDANSGGTHGVYLSMGRTEREQIAKKLIKMFRAGCNGKNYYKKWFPEFKDTGDFAAGFASEVYKLVRK